MKKTLSLTIITLLILVGILHFATLTLAKNNKPSTLPSPKASPAVTQAVLNHTTQPLTPTSTPRPASQSAKTTPSKTLSPTKKPTPTKKPSSTPLPTKKVRIPGQIGAATVTSLKGSTLTVSKEKKTYTILVVNGTLLRKHYWGATTLNDIAVNDKVNVTGEFINSSKTIMEATLIRDLSIMKRAGVVFGTITSLTTHSFSIKPKDHPLQKVVVNSKTVYVNRSENTISFTDLKVGDQVRIKGMWDRGTNTITDVTHLKDFSSPQASSPSAKTP